MARKTKSKAKSKTRKKAAKARRPMRKAARPKAKKAARKATRKAAPKAKAKPSAVPAGYHSIQPYLIVHDAVKAIQFYTAAFGAKERMRMHAPNGKIGHAELQIGDAVVMLADESPSWNAHGPRKFGGSPVSIMVYVKNVDDTVKKAVGAGAKITREVKDQFYGDRSGAVEDPFGHHWHVATHIEDVSPKEMDRRMKEAMKTMTPPQPPKPQPTEPKQPLSHASPSHPAPEDPAEAEASS